MNFKPMLAGEAEVERIRWPMFASPKLDGIRATFKGPNRMLVTRSLKLIPNRRIQRLFQFDFPLDGELIVGEAHHPHVFRNTTTVVMAHDAPIDNVTFRVFDCVGDEGFIERFAKAAELCEYKWMIPVPHTLLKNHEELYVYEEQMLGIGYEGVMLRHPHGKYKFGRSTTSEGLLLKLKRKKTSEAKVIGYEEQMHNANELKTDALGYAERSSHQANLVPMGTLGALVVTDLISGVTFNIGTGFTAAERQEIWNKREQFLGAVASYEYLPIGVKDKPRHPCFKGWRAKEDM